MTCKIIPVQEHYELHINGEFYCSADNLTEAKREIEKYEDLTGCILFENV